jgi:hypothetical protein
MNVSLDEIKRRYGVDPQAMRALHNALDNETKFSNPTNAYLNISESSSSLEGAASVRLSADRGTAPLPSATIAPVAPLPSLRDAPATVDTSDSIKETKPHSWKEKNEILSQKWRQRSEETRRRTRQPTLPIKEHLLTVSVRLPPAESTSSDSTLVSRPYQTHLSWCADLTCPD